MDKEAASKRHGELIGAGWQWRFTGEQGRVSLLRETYESLGMETRVEEGILGGDADCKTCFEAESLALGYRTLYTRGEARTSHRFDDDLF